MKKNTLFVLISLVLIFVLVGCVETGSPNDANNGSGQTPKYEMPQMGYITEFNKDKKTIELNLVEWITLNDTDKISELGLNPDNDMPSGFYINELNKKEKFKLNDSVNYEIVLYAENNKTDENGFEEHIAKQNADSINGIFQVVLDGNKVTDIQERYVP